MSSQQSASPDLLEVISEEKAFGDGESELFVKNLKLRALPCSYSLVSSFPILKTDCTVQFSAPVLSPCISILCFQKTSIDVVLFLAEPT